MNKLSSFLLCCALVRAVTLAPAASIPTDDSSYARPEEVRVDHLTLDLAVDFTRKQLSGTATWHLQRASAAAAKLILDTRDLTISRIIQLPAGVPATFTLGTADPLRGQKLTISLRPDATAVVITYTTSPAARALQWLEPAMTAGKKHPFLYSQSETILARTWVPSQDTPRVRFTYDATLRVPPELLALMSAENPSKKTANGIYHFHMPQPVPSYLLALAVGDLGFQAFDGRSGIYAEFPVLAAAAWEFAERRK